MYCRIPKFYIDKGFDCTFSRCAKVKPCRTVCSECVTCMCLCVCVCLQFSRIWSAFMWIIITLWRFFFPPFLTTTSAAEANNRGRVEAKRSGSLSLSPLSVSVSFSLLSASPLSLSPHSSFLQSLIFFRGPDHLRLEPWVDPEPLLSAQVCSNVQ